MGKLDNLYRLCLRFLSDSLATQSAQQRLLGHLSGLVVSSSNALCLLCMTRHTYEMLRTLYQTEVGLSRLEYLVSRHLKQGSQEHHPGSTLDVGCQHREKRLLVLCHAL